MIGGCVVTHAALMHTGQIFCTKQENFIYEVCGLRSLDRLFKDNKTYGDSAGLLNGPCYCTNKSHTSMVHPNRDDVNSNAEVCTTLHHAH